MLNEASQFSVAMAVTLDFVEELPLKILKCARNIMGSTCHEQDGFMRLAVLQRTVLTLETVAFGAASNHDDYPIKTLSVRHTHRPYAPSDTP